MLTVRRTSHRGVFLRIECIPVRLEGLEMSDLHISAAAATAAAEAEAAAAAEVQN
jgi:hypothetical protein